MDFEQAVETQRLRLLRILAGLLAAVWFLSAYPVSRGFSVWTCRFVDSVLSRAEAAAQCLVIAQARIIAAHNGRRLDQRMVSDALSRVIIPDELDASLPDCQRRLKSLRAMLMDLPRHALCLLRRLEKRARRGARACRVSPCPELTLTAPLCAWQLAEVRIERPPDKSNPVWHVTQPPPGFRAGGEGGYSRASNRSRI